MSFNVCFGCNEVGDIKTCSKTDCFAHDQRASSITMDDEYNSKAHLVLIREGIKLGIRVRGEL